MNRIARLVVMIIGVLLLVLGFGNILDDSRVLVYDLTAILAGIGFIVMSRSSSDE